MFRFRFDAFLFLPQAFLSKDGNSKGKDPLTHFRDFDCKEALVETGVSWILHLELPITAFAPCLCHPRAVEASSDMEQKACRG
jgi:hypothetical protein